MSCTIIALPVSLAYVIAGVALGSVGYMAEKKVIQNHEFEIKDFSNDIEDLKNDVKKFHDIQNINIAETTYITAYTDGKLLIKTLKEYGVENLSVNNDKIICKVDNYTLKFEKNNVNSQYNLNIICPENCKIDEKINDLNNEYTLNVQEEAYIHILEKLKENNMNVEEEEVLEDNTIILTINLEE